MRGFGGEMGRGDAVFVDAQKRDSFLRQQEKVSMLDP